VNSTRRVSRFCRLALDRKHMRDRGCRAAAVREFVE